MFTGIIKALGSITRIEPRSGDLRLMVESEDLSWQEFSTGDSIAVNGVCLTVVGLEPDGFSTDVSRETMAATSLQTLVRGSTVNLEPALALTDRLGGHFVSGHVDCVATVIVREDDARSVRLGVEIPAAYRKYIARKGSVTIDGVSLTVNDVDDDSFHVNIVPHSASCTIIRDYRVGTIVNIEVDLLARYIERLLTADDPTGISKDFLRAHGYA